MTTSIFTTNKTSSSSLVQKYPIPILFLLVLGLTWPFMIVDVLGSHGILPFRVPVALWLVMGYMPTLAAVIVTGLTQGREGVRALFRKILIAHVGFKWYAFAIFGLAAICVIAILLSNLFGATTNSPIIPAEMPAAGPLALLLNAVLGLIVRGIMNGEEFAWRGAALPRLQAKYNALTSSLFLSIPWILFHLPLFFTKGTSQADMSFACYAIQLAATSILFTWLYNNTRGSVLLAYLLHAAMNTWTSFFAIDSTNQFQGWILTGVFVVLAAIVIIISGAENLSRTNARIQE
ncbi:MAG: CPBP family intramembrane metalloprotease [Anaerolineales bacterium]|nr:CPBP family intramembrane metalloprotease [Anaerolineales bacterium]